MAVPAWVGAAIGGGAGLGGGIISAAAQGKRDHDARNFALMQGDIEWERMQKQWNQQNEYDEKMWGKQNEYNELQWNKQRQWDVEKWNMENDYNSPMMQMQRFKEAGLNPALIYGQQSQGGSMATANLETDQFKGKPAGPGARPGNWNPGVPNFDFLGESIMNYMAMRETGARTNLLEEQRNIAKQEVKFKAMQTANMALTNQRGNFDLDLSRELRGTSIDAARENLRKVTAEADYTTDKNSRETSMQLSMQDKIKEEIEHLKSQTKSEQTLNRIRELEYQLKSLIYSPIGTLNDMRKSIKDSPFGKAWNENKTYYWDGKRFYTK